MNTRMWEFYKNTEQGKKVIELFNTETEDLDKTLTDLFEYAVKWGVTDKIDDSIENYIQTEAQIAYDENFDDDLSEVSRDAYAHFIENFYVDEVEFDEEGEPKFTGYKWYEPNDFRLKAANIDSISLVLYFNFDFYKPILNRFRFDIIQRNCDALGMEIPPIPRSNDYMQYLLYYYDLCEAFNKFQQENNMTNAEFCACLYDFAAMLATQDDTKKVLPKPINVWFTGAADGDFKILDELGKGDNSDNPTLVWACNERTRRGDIVVIYCRTPRSYIHSIWRANSGGIFNPFDYYHCRTTVCEGVKIPPITCKELKEDAYFSQVPIVRKNLQGINGVELSAQDYSELLRFIKQKGGDISCVPRLFETGQIDFGKIKLEKDVEENILIPMLRRLGYTENDWTRQLSLKAGRNEKAIPDFVFFAKGAHHFENAPLLIEAKYDMSLITEQQKAFAQALSYSRMLRSKIMGICDKERILLYKVGEDGSSNRSKPIYENHWSTIYSNEIEGAKLKQLIGADVVRKL